METASLFRQKVGVVLSGTASHVTHAEGRDKDINKRKHLLKQYRCAKSN